MFEYPSNLTITNDKLPSATGSDNLTIKGAITTLEIWVDTDGFGPYFPDKIYTIAQKDKRIEIIDEKTQPLTDQNNDLVQLITTKKATIGTHSYIFHFTSPYSTNNQEALFKQILSTFELI